MQERGEPGSTQRTGAGRGSRLLKVAAGAAGVIVLLAAAGAIYEAVASRDDKEEHPPPGQVFDVLGRHMHIHCLGTGRPTVLLESGLGDSSATWDFVQPDIAQYTRVCSYDRAGYGWSEAASGERTFDRIADEWYALIETAGERAPFVLVGHSLGGYSVRLFHQKHPAEVAGIVAIDPTSDEGAPLPGFVASLPYRFFQVLGRVGAVRLLGRQIVQIQGGATPPPAVADAVPFLYGSNAMGTAANEIGDAGKSAEIVRGTRSVRLDGLPLAVITSGADREHHQWLADQSDRGRLIDAEGAGHYVHYSEPDLVTRTILEVVDESRRP